MIRISNPSVRLWSARTCRRSNLAHETRSASDRSRSEGLPCARTDEVPDNAAVARHDNGTGFELPLMMAKIAHEIPIT